VRTGGTKIVIRPSIKGSMFEIELWDNAWELRAWPARSLASYGVGRDCYIVTLKFWREIGCFPSTELLGRALGPLPKSCNESEERIDARGRSVKLKGLNQKKNMI
jgi:hypothetical protein